MTLPIKHEMIAFMSILQNEIICVIANYMDLCALRIIL